MALTQDIAKDEALWIEVRLMYGLLAGASGDLGHPEESVSVEPFQVDTNVTPMACVTSEVTAGIVGGDDDTTWSYP